MTKGNRFFVDEDDGAELDDDRCNGDGLTDGCRGPPEEGEEQSNKAKMPKSQKAKYGQDEKSPYGNWRAKKLGRGN